ncbi:ATP-grasp domain-containing protein [Mycobacterium angelicum]|uniref:ATP-grasp domain-containing protein n=1 Tax=Mycobacterium angelicum TaxID=470074 RepID=A0A1X0A2U6_MYCAN|nr:ATP-grasp domain-containing protein [Mycobacterium angelicum]MCV7197237.1 ATP-grasp domain-containing protein [Mycobacterium angelicum]ORA24324.1 hypothetical protein BST12_06030 [Mycobacterium angelicum]
MTDRARLIDEIVAKLGDRRLVWFGTRGDDVQSVAELPQLSAVFSVINSYTSSDHVTAMSLEEVSRKRVDLDTFSVDDHPQDVMVGVLRSAIYAALSGPAAVLTYRPSEFLSAITFAKQRHASYLGIFAGMQQAFEHKPWVESAVAKLGLPRVPWHYIADSEFTRAHRLLYDGPVMLRRSRTTGGVGFSLVKSTAELENEWPSASEAFVSVAPYFDDAIPVNVSGVVWPDGVSVHPASIQLIGIEGCTTRQFAYCGNDFAAVVNLGQEIVEDIESAVRAIGGWLRSQGYLGAFGVDFLVCGGVPLFSEVNPRFQGSTRLSCDIAVEMGLGCLLLDHIASFLGIHKPEHPSLWEISTGAPPRAQIVVHHTGDTASAIDPTNMVDAFEATGTLLRADVLTHPDLDTDPCATVARLTVDRTVTRYGYELIPDFKRIIPDLKFHVGVSAAMARV